MGSRTYLMWSLAMLAGVAALVMLGLRIAPQQQASNSAESVSYTHLTLPTILRV